MSATTNSEKSVAIHIDREEFRRLSTLMSPLYFDESKGASVWVSSDPDLSRSWIVRDNEGAIAIVDVQGARTDRLNFEEGDETWAYPVSEIMLIGLGKVLMLAEMGDLTCDVDDDDESSPTKGSGVVLILSDSHCILRGAGMEMSIPQNHRVSTPPIRPEISAPTGFDLDPSQLWCILSQARTWPASGECNGMNTPMLCRVDPACDDMVITVDWSSVGNGISTYRLPIEWHMRHQQNGPTEFVMPHSVILNVLRDAFSARQLERINFKVGNKADSHILLWGPHWAYFVPIVPDVTMWGHDLDEVLCDNPYMWKTAALVKVWSDGLDREIDLVALPDDALHAPYRYRASYEVCPNVIPTIDLYNEINLLNEKLTGYRLVIEGNRVLALTDYTKDNYRELDMHISAFARQVSGLQPLLSALSVS